MKLKGLKSFIGIITLLAICAVPAISAEKQLAADGAVGTAPAAPVDLSESARGSSEAADFLSQPALSEALAKAQSDKRVAQEASKNPTAFLAKNGVKVPANMKVEIMPPKGDGAAARVSVTITIRCCPLNITIVIRL